MYEAERDPYCYPGTDVLKNKAGLTSAGALERFETAMTFARSEEPLRSRPAGSLGGWGEMRNALAQHRIIKALRRCYGCR